MDTSESLDALLKGGDELLDALLKDMDPVDFDSLLEGADEQLDELLRDMDTVDLDELLKEYTFFTPKRTGGNEGFSTL